MDPHQKAGAEEVRKKGTSTKTGVRNQARPLDLLDACLT
jgi:hypothetical protein